MTAKKDPFVFLRQLLSLLLHEIYGIKLKWETHTEDVVWGEGLLRGDLGGLLSTLLKWQQSTLDRKHPKIGLIGGKV